MPKVSVIIPTYECGRWLPDAINSVLTQTLTNFELIIVDDGSTDNTKDIIGDFKDDQIHYFYKTHSGVAATRNVGLSKAAGEYVAFLDADDLWPQDYLEVMTAVLDNSDDYGVAYTTITQVWPDGRRIESYRLKHCVSGWITPNLFNKFFVLAQAAVIRKSVLEGFHYDESTEVVLDCDFFLRLSLRTKFLFVRDVQPIRRVRPNSLSAEKIYSAIGCHKIRVLERFYYDLNGKNYISKIRALRRISRCYNKAAKRYYEYGARKAAIYLFKQAILYNPFSPKAYAHYVKALFSIKSPDKMPNWQMPKELDSPQARVRNENDCNDKSKQHVDFKTLI